VTGTAYYLHRSAHVSFSFEPLDDGSSRDGEHDHPRPAHARTHVKDRAARDGLATRPRTLVRPHRKHHLRRGGRPAWPPRRQGAKRSAPACLDPRKAASPSVEITEESRARDLERDTGSNRPP